MRWPGRSYDGRLQGRVSRGGNALFTTGSRVDGRGAIGVVRMRRVGIDIPR